MRDTRKLEFRVGVVSLIGIILLIFGISIGKNLRLATNSNILSFEFSDSGGLKSGEPVVVNGVERGSITSVENLESKVIVKAALNKIDDIKKDATARITLLEITGGKKLEIYPGESNKIITTNDLIPGTTPADLPDLVAILGDVSDDAVILIRRLDTIAASASLLLSDEKFINDIKYTAANANNITTKLDNFIDDNYNELDNAITNLSELSTDLKNAFDENEPKIVEIIDELNSTIKETREVVSKAGLFIDGADELIANLNSVVQSIKNDDGIINKIIYDKEFSKEIENTLSNLKILLEAVNQHGINVNVRIGTRP